MHPPTRFRCVGTAADLKPQRVRIRKGQFCAASLRANHATACPPLALMHRNFEDVTQISRDF